MCLAYASARGQAWLERALSLPKEGTNERARCALAGLPPERAWATQPALARRMVAQACQAGGAARWGTGDSVEGADRRRRLWWEEHDPAYGLAVSGQEYVWLGWRQQPVTTVLATLPAEGWTRCSAGAGAQGPRGDDWGWGLWAAPLPPAWRRWWLGRRRMSQPTELTACVVFAPQATSLAEAVHVAGTRWTMASRFEAAKGDGGLAHYEGRSWPGW